MIRFFILHRRCVHSWCLPKFNYWIDESRVEQVAFSGASTERPCLHYWWYRHSQKENKFFIKTSDLSQSPLCFQTIHLNYRDCETSTLHWNYLWCCRYQKENIFSKRFPVWRTAFSLPGVFFEVPWSWKIDVDRRRKRETPRDVHPEWSCDMEAFLLLEWWQKETKNGVNRCNLTTLKCYLHLHEPNIVCYILGTWKHFLW